MFFLKLFFHHEGHFYVNCLFYIPTIYLKYLLFQFFSYGIRMHISILTGVENGHISRLKESVFCQKMFLLKLLLDDEGHFYANCLTYIPTIYLQSLLFQFFSRGIRMYIPILTGVQNGHISLPKNNLMLKKKFFLRLFFRDEGHLYA